MAFGVSIFAPANNLNRIVLQIPQPHLVNYTPNEDGLGTGIPSIGAYFLPNDDQFLNYNPQYWLLRYKRRHKRHNALLLRRKNVWTHPTHNNGINFPASSLYGGAQYDSSGTLIPNRETEWNLVTVNPYDITNIIINPMLWFAASAFQTGGFTFPINYNDWTSNTVNVRTTGQHGRYFPGVGKSLVFALVITVDNPNVPNQKIFGPMSNTFKIYPKIRNGGTDDEFYTWKVKIHNDYAKNRS